MSGGKGFRRASSARLTLSLLLIHPTLLASCTSSLFHQPLGIFDARVADGPMGPAAGMSLRFDCGLVDLLRGGDQSAQNGGDGSAAHAGSLAKKGRDDSLSDCRDSTAEGRIRAAGSDRGQDSKAVGKGESSRNSRGEELRPVPVRESHPVPPKSSVFS